MKIKLLLSTAILSCFLLPVSAQDQPALILSKTIPLPDFQGGFNHLSVDAGHRRLFVTAPASKTLEIIDLNSGKLWRSLPGEKPAAALFAPEFNQLYVTRGQKVCLYDGTNFNLLASVDLKCGLDELQYDPKAGRLYVGCMTSNQTAIAIISIPDGSPKGIIKLPAKPKGFVVEKNGSRIFANLPGLQQIAVLDREKQVLLAAWPLKDVSANYPIALDESNHRLFVGCRRPAQLVVLDTLTGAPVTGVPISGDTDDLSYDAAHNRVYIASGEGFLDVIEQLDANHYRLRERIQTREGARNSVFPPTLNEFYLAVPPYGKQPAEIRVFDP
ncbi:MAG: repeat containing protein [Pedosphaera sp.]|nr:repeat containing protein [Pedosphaera sp.]